MNQTKFERHSERGSAAVKFLFIFVFLALVANAGYNYIPVAYSGASFRQEMDTAVVKGLAASGRMKPLEVVTASVKRAAADHAIPPEAFIEVKPVAGVVQARAVYTLEIPILPFGMYNYQYNFDYTAAPVGYLLKQ